MNIKLKISEDMIGKLVDVQNLSEEGGCIIAVKKNPDTITEIIIKSGELLIPDLWYIKKVKNKIFRYNNQWGVKKIKEIDQLELGQLYEFNPTHELNEVINMYFDKIEYKDEKDTPEMYLENVQKYPNIEWECDKILMLVQREQDFLCKPENRPFLAYIMTRWQNLYYAGRICYGFRGDCLIIAPLGQCENNPKYEFEDMMSDDNEGIVYDAWCADMDFNLPLEFRQKYWMAKDRVQYNEEDFTELSRYFNVDDDFTKLSHKPNKTMDDWYALLGDERYEYHSIYTTRHSIDDHLLCVIGNGYDWNKDGYICHDGPSGEDMDSFGKCLMIKGHTTGHCAELEAELNEILMQPAVQDTLNKAKDWWLGVSTKNKKKELMAHLQMTMRLVVKDIKSSPEYEYPAWLVEIASQNHGLPDEEREAIKEKLSAFTKERDDARAAAGGKRWSEMTFDEKIKLEEDVSSEERALSLKILDDDEATWKAIKNYIDANMDFEMLRTINNLNEISYKLIRTKHKDIFDDGDDDYEEDREKNGKYYPISQYSKISKIPKNAHESYIKACVRICQNIVNGSKNWNDKMHKENKDNLKFAKKFLDNYDA